MKHLPILPFLALPTIPSAALVDADGIPEFLPLEAYVKASNTGFDDRFGDDVELAGDTLVIGASSESSASGGVNGNQLDDTAPQAGAAYVLVREAGDWTQQAYLKAAYPDIEDRFGKVVAISGDTVVVGAYREDSGAIGVGGDPTDNSSLDAGAVYVFVRNGTAWTEQAYIKASNTDPEDRFGRCVAIEGDTLVVTATREDSGASGVDGDDLDNSVQDSGAAYVFVRNGTTWTQQAYLKASNPGVDDWFGSSVEIFGDRIVVGAEQEASAATGIDGDQNDDTAPNAGAAYVFVRNGTTWSQEAYLKASNTEAYDRFGEAVSIDGDTIVVTAEYEDGGIGGVNSDQSDNSEQDSGSAYVFVREGSTWTQQAYLKATNPDDEDSFGDSTAISGDRIVVGAYAERSSTQGVGGDELDNSAEMSGAAYVFERVSGVWGQIAYVKASNTGEEDQLGGAIDIEGDRMIVGAITEDGGATGINGPDNNSIEDSGAAYIYTFDTTHGLWARLGGGTEGIAGTPRFEGSSTLQSGAPVSLWMTDTPSSSAAVLLVSLTSNPFPLFGGTAHAFPAILQEPYPTTAQGTLNLGLSVPASLPSGTNIWFQCINVDDSVAEGVTLSNGLRATTP